METTVSGRCLCGAIRYTASGDIREVVNCHCGRCRRITGHHMAATGCDVEALELDDDGSLRWYEAGPGVFYGFCCTCGSTLFWRADARPGWISIAAGTLEQPTGLRTASAWWTAEAADYHDLDPSIVHHAYEPDA